MKILKLSHLIRDLMTNNSKFILKSHLKLNDSSKGSVNRKDPETIELQSNRLLSKTPEIPRSLRQDLENIMNGKFRTTLKQTPKIK